MSGARLVQLDGAFNVRDLGGYESQDGRTVRWRHVYRADSLHLLSDSDATSIARLDLRAIYDLRRLHERTRHPTRLPSHHRHRDVHLDVFDDPAATPGLDLLEQLASGRWYRRSDGEMIDRYIEMLVDGAPVFGRLLTALASPHGLPAMVHCAAGKDRTGVAAALILSVLGVDRDTVIDDYAATNTYRTGRYVDRVRPAYEAQGIDVEQIRLIVDARPAVLAGALGWLDTTYHSTEEYLVRTARVDPSVIDTLRHRLLE